MSAAKRVGSKTPYIDRADRTRDTPRESVGDILFEEEGARDDLAAARDEVLGLLTEAYQQARRSRGRVRFLGADVYLLLPPFRQLSAPGFVAPPLDDPELELSQLN